MPQKDIDYFRPFILRDRVAPELRPLVARLIKIGLLRQIPYDGQLRLHLTRAGADAAEVLYLLSTWDHQMHLLAGVDGLAPIRETIIAATDAAIRDLGDVPAPTRDAQRKAGID